MRVDDVRAALDRLADLAPDPAANAAGAAKMGSRRLARRRMLASGTVVLVIAVAAIGVATRADDARPGLVVSTPTAAPTTLPPSAVPAVVQPAGKTIIFTSATEGWVCADPILHTANGGRTWQQVPYDGLIADRVGRVCGAVPGGDLWMVVGAHAPSELLVQGGSDGNGPVDLPKLPPGGTITQITFADVEHGWVLARTPGDGPGHGFLYRSVESGLRFALVSRDAPVNGVQFADANEGWGIGDGQLEHSSDGGAHWKVVNLPVGRQVLDSVTIHGSTLIVSGAAQTGSTAGDPVFVVVSHDDGASWKVVEGPAALRVSDFARYFFVATDAAHWRIAYGGRLWSTDDGGATWRDAALPPALAQLSSIQFPTPEIGWAIAGNALSKTTDGGSTWQAVATAPVPDWRTGLADVPTGCPSRAVTPAPITAASRAAATQAAREFVLRTRGWTGNLVDAAYPVTEPANTAAGGIFAFNIPKFCGRAVADATYGVEMDDTLITEDNSRVTALVVGHFADGWHVWGWYK